MAKAVRTRGGNQQEIVKLINRLDGKYSKWHIWNDFILMFATSIANVFPSPHREHREKLYMETAKKYSKGELDIMAKMMALVVTGMEDNPDQDFLGELYMCMDMGNQWTGQFFTPYDVCKAMSLMSYSDGVIESQVRDRGFVGVSDPACGAGALLIAFANVCREKKLNYQQHCLFIAQDIDQLAGMMCYIQLSLMGCAGHVIVDNTLVKPAQFYDERALLPVDGTNVWTTPMMYSETWQIRQIAARMALLTGRLGTARDTVIEKLPAPAVKEPEPAHVVIPELKADETGQLSLF
jgi:hypothetical protein